MQIQKINSLNINNNQQKNDKTSFGMRFEIKRQVVDDFIKAMGEKTKRCDCDRHETRYIAREVLINAKNLIRSIIEHNSNESNHLIYPETVEIVDINAGLRQEGNQIKLQNIISLTVGENEDTFHILTENPNLAGILQEKLIEEKSEKLTESANDLEYLLNKMEELKNEKTK